MTHMEEIILEQVKLQKRVPQHCIQMDSPVMVLLDPGHGGWKDGKYTTAPNKMSKFPDFEFYEGVWNRMLTWTHAELLYHSGYSYNILVSENDDVTLQERVRRAVRISKLIFDPEDHTPFKFYYHSIHANAFGVESVSGIEVWTSPGQTKSDVVATLFYRKLAQLGWNMRAEMGDGDPDKEENFYVLKETPMPAILTETGFYTNRIEAIKMLDLFNINRIAHLFTEAHAEVVKLHLL